MRIGRVTAPLVPNLNINGVFLTVKMALFKHQHLLSTDSTDTDDQDWFSPYLQQSCQFLHMY
jgi:hypothetical protein